MNSEAVSPGPLDGIRILDMTWMLAGPYCTMLLADMGADVIKVENPSGDPVRAIGPHFEDDQERHFGGYFQSVNRGKRSIVLDLKTDKDKGVLFHLARKSDAVVENFRVGVMERLGVSYERLRGENPALVYCSIRGFGDPRTAKTQLNNHPAMDYIAQAMGGLMSITGTDGSPMKTGAGVGDLFPGALGALGVVSAILSARTTGKGQFVDVSMYDSIVSLCERIVYQYGYTKESPVSSGNRHPLWSLYNTFKTKDGFVCISAVFDHEWQRLAEAMERKELAEDERFRTTQDRLSNDDAANDIVREWVESKSRDEVMEILGGIVPSAPIQTAEDLFNDPHLKSRNMLVEVEHPGSAQKGVIAGSPIQFLGTPAMVQDRAPTLGEHTDEIIEELGNE